MFTLIINLIILVIAIAGIVRPQAVLSKKKVAELDDVQVASAIKRTRISCIFILVVTIIMTIRGV